MSKKSKDSILDNYGGLINSLLIANGVSILLFILRVIDSGGFRYWFLLWNLLLAWLPLVFALTLTLRLKTTRLKDTVNILLIILWLGFLPNSFYLVSDLIHLQITAEVSVLYDAVLFMSFIMNGFISGYLSVYFVHTALIKRLGVQTAHYFIGFVFLLCGFAIYLGRVLRWNSWDLFLHPTSIAFDVSEQVVNQAAQSRASVTTLSFFILTGGMYLALWQLVRDRKN
ncbi:MAG: DUF1361 domain-containing protein [Candidatus Saccharimonadales bacterium]